MKLEIFCFTNELNNLSYRLSELRITFFRMFCRIFGTINFTSIINYWSLLLKGHVESIMNINKKLFTCNVPQ